MHTLVAENLAIPLRIRPSLKERSILQDRGHPAQTARPTIATEPCPSRKAPPAHAAAGLNSLSESIPQSTGIRRVATSVSPGATLSMPFRRTLPAEDSLHRNPENTSLQAAALSTAGRKDAEKPNPFRRADHPELCQLAGTAPPVPGFTWVASATIVVSSGTVDRSGVDARCGPELEKPARIGSGPLLPHPIAASVDGKSASQP
jgi:hypothetical protein